MCRKGEGAITRDGDGRGMAGEAAVLSPRTTTTLTPEEEAEWQAREYAAYLALKRGEPVRYRAPGEKVGRPFFYKRRPVSYKVTRAEPAEEALAILYETILTAMEEADDFVALVAEAHRLRFINTIENQLETTPGITLPEGFFPAFAALSQGEEQQLDAVLAKLRLEYLQTLERIASSYATRIGMKTREALEIKALVLSRPTRPQVETRIEQEKERLRTRINQRLDQLRQRALGITHYVWRSQDDARVRPAHAQNDGRIFSWSTPPSTGHPGDDFGCRCSAEPHFDEEPFRDAITEIPIELFTGGLGIAAIRAGGREIILNIFRRLTALIRATESEEVVPEGEEIVPDGEEIVPEGENPPPPNNDIFQRPEGVPEEWVEEPAGKGDGVKYVDPENVHNDVRIQRGNPESDFPSQRNDYVKWKRNGQWLDKNGNPVLGDSPEAHIPFDEFNFDIELFR